jgi:hypothetical protein
MVPTWLGLFFLEMAVIAPTDEDAESNDNPVERVAMVAMTMIAMGLISLICMVVAWDGKDIRCVAPAPAPAPAPALTPAPAPALAPAPAVPLSLLPLFFHRYEYCFIPMWVLQGEALLVGWLFYVGSDTEVWAKRRVAGCVLAVYGMPLVHQALVASHQKGALEGVSWHWLLSPLTIALGWFFCFFSWLAKKWVAANKRGEYIRAIVDALQDDLEVNAG